MNPDSEDDDLGGELDAFLTRQLDEAELADSGFAGRVTSRLIHQRRVRRLTLAGAGAAATGLAILGLGLSPAPFLQTATVAPEDVFATLLLLAACGLVWIATAGAAPIARR